MGLKAAPDHINKKELPVIASGLTHGVLYGLFHIGHQKSFNDANAPKDKVVLIFELPFERCEFDDKETGSTRNLPRAMSKKLTRSMHPKSTMRKMLTQWRGRAFTDDEADSFELTSLLGVNGQLFVTHKIGDGQFVGRTFAEIDSILPLGKDTAIRKSENPHVYFSFHDIKPGDDIVFPKGMPDWVRRLAINSPEYDHLKSERDKAISAKGAKSFQEESRQPSGEATPPPITPLQVNKDPY